MKRTSLVDLGIDVVVSSTGTTTRDDTEAINEELAAVPQWQIRTNQKVDLLGRFCQARKEHTPHRFPMRIAQTHNQCSPGGSSIRIDPKSCVRNY